MKRRIYIMSLLCCLSFVPSCKTDKTDIIISGQLANLPDGKMVLFTRSRKTGNLIPIDTVETQTGSFRFLVDTKRYPEPINVFLTHTDAKSKMTRIISFPTNLKINGAPLGVDNFMLEDGVQVNGILKVDHFEDFSFNKNIIPTSLDRPLITGRQTHVAYNDTADFDRVTNPVRLKNLVTQHPYSYYYLYSLERRVSLFSNEAFLSIFHCFDQDVQLSKTGQQLLTCVRQRADKRLTFSTKLSDSLGRQRAVLVQTNRYTLVVLWASWCGPCRREIPSLKQLYTRLGPHNGFRIVSVSVDGQREKWMQALAKEQMPWHQLWVAENDQLYVKDIFRFDGSIPTMLLVDQQGKTVKTVVGYDDNNLTQIEAIVGSR